MHCRPNTTTVWCCSRLQRQTWVLCGRAAGDFFDFRDLATWVPVISMHQYLDVRRACAKDTHQTCTVARHLSVWHEAMVVSQISQACTPGQPLRDRWPCRFRVWGPLLHRLPSSHQLKPWWHAGTLQGHRGGPRDADGHAPAAGLPAGAGACLHRVPQVGCQWRCHAGEHSCRSLCRHKHTTDIGQKYQISAGVGTHSRRHWLRTCSSSSSWVWNYTVARISRPGNCPLEVL